MPWGAAPLAPVLRRYRRRRGKRTKSRRPGPKHGCAPPGIDSQCSLIGTKSLSPNLQASRRMRRNARRRTRVAPSIRLCRCLAPKPLLLLLQQLQDRKKKKKKKDDFVDMGCFACKIIRLNRKVSAQTLLAGFEAALAAAAKERADAADAEMLSSSLILCHELLLTVCSQFMLALRSAGPPSKVTMWPRR